MSRLNDAQIVRAMALLEVRPEDFSAVEQAPTLEVSQERLQALKERVKKRFRQLAFTLHPDKTGNDPAKTEDFRLVAAALEEFEKTKIHRRPPPPPPPQRMTISVQFVRRGVDSTTSTASGTSFRVHLGRRHPF